MRTPNSWRVRRRNAWLTPWPSWVYNLYDDLLLTQRVIDELKKTTMLKPHLLKVGWCAGKFSLAFNLHLSVGFSVLGDG